MVGKARRPRGSANLGQLSLSGGERRFSRLPMAAIDAAPLASVVKAFHVCEPAGLGPDKRTELFSYALESMP